jgi:hypothetical protein
MKTSNKLGFISLVSLLFCTCTVSVSTNNELLKNKKATSEDLSSAINISEKRKDINKEGYLQHEVAIEDLPDGSYGFCKQLTSKKVTSDLEGWCFMFSKSQNHIVGLYTLWLPSDYARICIDGATKENTITGNGYEIIESDSSFFFN